MFAGRRFPEAFALAVLVANAAQIAVTYASLPPVVPMHFDVFGQPGNYGLKWTIWTNFGFGAFMYLALTAVARIPTRYANLPVKVTDENRERLGNLLRDMITWLKAWIQVISYVLSAMIIRASSTRSPQLGLTLIEYAATLATFATCIIYIIRMRRAA